MGAETREGEGGGIRERGGEERKTVNPLRLCSLLLISLHSNVKSRKRFRHKIGSSPFQSHNLQVLYLAASHSKVSSSQLNLLLGLFSRHKQHLKNETVVPPTTHRPM